MFIYQIFIDYYDMVIWNDYYDGQIARSWREDREDVYINKYTVVTLKSNQRTVVL